MTSHPTRSLLVSALLVAFVAALALPATAAARDGQRWPGTRITYYDATRDKLAVSKAVQAWNRTGIRMRFVRTFNRRNANVVIRNTRDVPGGCGTGLATVGYVGRGRQAYVNILHGYARNGQACAWPGQSFVVAHELGHVLGLDHFDRGCALMNSSHTDGIAATRCLPGNASLDRFGQWRCRLVEPMDIRRALRLYGGRMRPVRKNPWCTIVKHVSAPVPFTTAYDSNTNAVTVTMRRPATPAAPPYLDRDPQAPRAEVYISDRCLLERPTVDAEGVYTLQTFDWSVDEGQDHTFTYQNPYRGSTSCLSAWTFDTLGRASATSARAIVDAAPAGAARMHRLAKLSGPTPHDTRVEPRTYHLHGDTARR